MSSSPHSTAPSSPRTATRRRLIRLLAGVGGLLVLLFVARAASPTRRAAVHLERGKLYLHTGRPTAALAELERSRELAPPAWEARYYIAEALADSDRVAEAVAEWRALKDSPLGERALSAAVARAREAGEIALARAVLEEARAAGFTAVSFTVGDARLRREAGDTAGALEQYREALARQPGRVDLIVELAGLHMEAGAVQEARTVLTDALAAQPESVPLLLRLGELEKDVGRTDAALAVYRRAVKAAPDLEPARTALMQLLSETGAWDEAEAEATQLLDAPNSAPLAHFVLGQVRYARHDDAAALRHLTQARAAMPHDPLVLLWLGRTQLRHGEPEAGLQALQEAVGRAPKDVTVRLALVRALWDLSRFAEAREAAGPLPDTLEDRADRALVQAVRASEAEDLDSLDVDALLMRSEAALGQGRIEEARRAAASAHRRAPDDPRPLVGLALAAVASQDVRTALGYFEEARRRRPGNAAAAINRARLLRSLGQPQLGAQTLLSALSAEQADTAALLPEAATVLLSLGRAAETEALIRTHGPAPLGEDLRILLAQAMLRQGRAADAGKALGEGDSVATRLCRLRVHLALGEDAAATSTLAGLMDTAPYLGSLRDLLFPGEPSVESATGAVADHPVARACALARGRVDLCERVAAEGGDGGKHLALLALAVGGQWDAAHAWQAQHWPGTPPLAPDGLPADPQAYGKALVLQLVGWPSAAARFFADAGVPGSPVLVSPLINSTAALGRREEALALATAATADAPPVAEVWQVRVQLAAEVQDPAVAYTTVTRALGVVKTPDLLAFAGRLAEQAGEQGRAVQYYRQALDRGAGPAVQNLLAWQLAADAETRDEAVTLAEAAQAAAPFSPEVADTLGWCYLQQERPEQALFYANLAVLLDPEQPELRYHRAEALAAAGRLAPARDDCETLKATAPAEFVARPDVSRLCARF